MSNSKLITYTKISPMKSSPRNHIIDSVAIHTMAGNLTIEACGNIFQNKEASSNYGIDSQGRIGLYVDEKDRSWCTSNAGVDNRAITIEVASLTASEPFQCSTAAYVSLINLLVDICQRNNISSLRWKNDKAYAVSAAAGGPVTKQNMFVHRWFAAKSCPGNYLFSLQGQIANEVNAKLKSGYIPNAGDIADVTPVSTVINIDYEKFNPYVLILRRDDLNINYASLKSSKVVACIVEGGYLFSSYTSRFKAYRFDNQNLEDQVKRMQDNEIPFGMFTYGRAHTVADARSEMYGFSFPIRRHPPQLGAWIQLELGSIVSVNDLIMQEYYNQLVRLGFMSRMGIICNRSMLKQISWESKWKDKFFLCLIDRVSSLDDINKLLDPEFFDTDGQG